MLTRTIDANFPRAVINLGAIHSGAESDSQDGGWIDGRASPTLTQVRHLADLGHMCAAFAQTVTALVALRARHCASRRQRRRSLDECRSCSPTKRMPALGF